MFDLGISSLRKYRHPWLLLLMTLLLGLRLKKKGPGEEKQSWRGLFESGAKAGLKSASVKWMASRGDVCCVGCLRMAKIEGKRGRGTVGGW